MLSAALCLSLYNLWDAGRAAKSVENVLEQMDAAALDKAEAGRFGASPGEEPVPDAVFTPEMEMPAEMFDGNRYIGRLEVPSLHLVLPVIEDWSYPKLRLAPCRYKGSAYLGDLIVAAHNYPRHFGGLKKLAPGDSVIFTDMDENRFTYEVTEVRQLGPAAMEEMEAGEWDLTLFTCTVGGGSRVAVRCVELDGAPPDND
ncbi:MAG: sortase [Clostridiales bacterium]|nr:sortase [Clostridiales bacterium]